MPFITAFDVDPETTPIKIPGPLVQRLELRAGDDLPGFAAIVEDDLGNPVDLTGARAYFCLSDGRGRWIVRRQCFIANPASGVVTFDWSSIQTYTWGVGSHPLAILVRWPDGRELTAPSQKSSVTFEIRPSSEFPLPPLPPLPGPLTVTITASVLQVANAPVELQVDFSASADGFNPEDVIIGGTAGPTTVTVFGSGAHYTVTIGGMTHTGTVTAFIPANVVINAEVAVDIPNEESNHVTVDYLIEHFGYVVTSWGGWTATASSTFIERAATIASPWGTWVATAVGPPGHEIGGYIDSDWGWIEPIDTAATTADSWGTWTAPTVGTVSTFSPTAPLGVGFAHLYWVGGPEFLALGLADGANVTNWPDEAGTADVPCNGAAAQVYRSNASALGGPAIDWSSTTTAGVVTAFTQGLPNSIVVICKWSAIGYVVDGFDGTHRRIIRNSGSVWSHYAGVDATGGTADTTTKHAIVSKIVSGTSDILKVDGATVSTASAGDQTMTGLHVGSDFNGTNDFSGFVALIGVYNGDVESSPGWAAFQAWALATYGVTF